MCEKKVASKKYETVGRVAEGLQAIDCKFVELFWVLQLGGWSRHWWCIKLDGDHGSIMMAAYMM